MMPTPLVPSLGRGGWVDPGAPGEAALQSGLPSPFSFQNPKNDKAWGNLVSKYINKAVGLFDGFFVVIVVCLVFCLCK